jgi:hypothetical protein
MTKDEELKQLIEDLISAMEYHVEQTRPIHSTTVALQAAREALKAMPAPVQPVAFEVGLVEWVGNKLMATPKVTTTPPASWMEMVTANLVREGVTKHKARELAEHFYGLAQRQWVGVTLTDREKLRERYGWNYPPLLVDAVSDILEGKNT